MICIAFGVTKAKFNLEPGSIIKKPTVRAGIKALCKSGVLSVYDIKRIIRISDRYSAEVYNLETITALAFRIESFGAAKVRRALLERIIHGRKENSLIFLSLNVGSQAVISS